ncbi:MAG: TFIIB-type zinc finger domain-containing protein [Pseudomonadota bacterium]
MLDTPAALQNEQHFPCNSCGADMRFDARGGQMVCDHCGNTIALDEASEASHPLAELDFRAAIANELPKAEMETTRVSKCPNCAAEVQFDPTLHAMECPFCATPVVADTGEHRHIKPRGVLPFAVDEKAARDAMNDWLGRLWFAPNGLQDYARKGRRMQGIYVPYWTYDADTATAYAGERGTIYYQTRTVMRDGRREQVRVPKIRWRPKKGRVKRFFDDVLVLASRSLPKRYTEALQPWDLSALEPYSSAYLAGFRAEGYAITLEEGFSEARKIMDAAILRDIRFDIGGDQQRVHRVSTDVRDVTFKHVLLPVWLAAYKYRGETYRFVVNGRTCKVQGERPWSATKIAFAVIVGVLAAAAFGYLYAMTQ